MQRYEITSRTYIVHDEQLYRQEGSSNHPIDTEKECWDAVLFRGDIGEFECHQGTGSVPRIVETDGGTEVLEIVHCGGCNGRSLLRDARAAGHRDDTTIDKPHCPRCGTRLSYEATEVVPYSPNDGRPGDGDIEEVDPDA